jgi:aminoglycoside phosphotransferase (APT) family kinase protein
MPTLVAFINAQHGTTFRLSERILHGNRNVAGVYNASSARFIVKWSPGAQDLSRLPEAVRLVDRLRSRWYPVPRYVARGLHPGGRYVVQTALPGAPVTRLNPPQVEQIIALNDIQRDLASPPAASPPTTSPAAEPWPARVTDDVLHGGDGYCLLEPMRRHTPMTARLLEIVQELVARHRHVTTPATDVVHFDFQPNNMLGLSGKISGVVDWDAAQAGDRAFDLVTLLFYAYDQETIRDALWRRVAEITDPAAIGVYVAHLIHRQVDWSIRHHPPSTVDHWLERAQVILRDLPGRTGCQVPAWP